MNIPHTYSFTALYEDGTIIELDRFDPEGDKCLCREDGTGSRFTDVKEKEKESKLVSFVIHNDHYSAGVDLTDGHFEINSIPFWQHRPDLDGYQDFRVIYYRTVQQTISQSGEVLSGEVMAYVVGWQTNDEDGFNVKRFVRI